MTSVATLIEAVHAAGGQLHQKGERLTVRAALPLDERLVAELRAAKPELLAFLAAERQDGAPPEWRVGVGRLTRMAPLPGFAPRRWATLVTDARNFIEVWSGQAARLGWSTYELFGVHCTAPAARLDAMGLVPALAGDRVVAMTTDAATIENPSGARLRHFRQRHAPECEIALVWELA